MTDFRDGRRLLTTTVYESDPLVDGDIIGWFQKKLDLKPLKYRDRVYFSVILSPADKIPMIGVSYCRSETDREYDDRCKRERILE